jgi:hypothetical protein
VGDQVLICLCLLLERIYVVPQDDLKLRVRRSLLSSIEGVKAIRDSNKVR